MQVVHAMTGLVRSGVMLTFFQVLSRETLLWLVASSGGPTIQTHYGFVMMVIAWTFAEIIRYSYTLFIVLYPTGVMGELLLIGNMLPIAKETGMFSYRLPNQWNISFDFFTALCCATFLYIPVFPQLYMHMLVQRRKILGGHSVKQDKAD
eukprot:m.35519 g.35519  ORF g.35519 m.35519 type:complete len:150 (+) comp32138_c0_seq4:296-745(+)